MSPATRSASSDQGRVRIPADVERPDKLLAGLTARQLAILSVAALVLWAGYAATRHLVAPALYGAAAIPVAAVACLLALGRVEGVPADRWVASAWRQHRAPHRLVPAPEGVPPLPGCLAALGVKGADARSGLPAPLRLPLAGVDASGVVDLGGDGLAVICRASAVTFSLRTPEEQEALVAGFARYLNSLAEPVQVLVRAEPLDVTPAVERLVEAAPGLPHVALERACRDHAAFLQDLAQTRTLLRREVLVVLRQPKGQPDGARGTSDKADTDGHDDSNGTEVPAGTDDAARLARRANEAVSALAAAGVSVSVLDGSAAASVLARCLDPDTPAHSAANWAASPDEPVTRATTPDQGAAR